MSQRLPSIPNLDHLKKQAKDVLRVARRQRSQWRLSDAQQALARGYGFATWTALKLRVESITPEPGAPSSEHRQPKARTSKDADHSIIGTWTEASPVNGSRHAPHVGSVLVEFAPANDALVLTQIGPDAAGCDVAMKVAIQVDGLEHPVPFGDHVTLRATWIDGHTLETIARRGEQMVWQATYEVSSDRQSLVVSSAERVVRFERVAVE